MQNVYKRFNVNKKYIWKKSKAIIISVLSFFGLVSPFFSLEDIFNKDRNNFLQEIVHFSFILLFIGFLIFIAVTVYTLIKQKVVICKFHNNHELSVSFGDILNLPTEGKRNIIIPVNRCFDTIVDNELISENTLHGKVLKVLYADNIFNQQELNKQIQDQLNEMGDIAILNKAAKNKGNSYQYPAGTIVEISDKEIRYFLVGFSKFDSDLHASVSKREYLNSMNSILEYIEKKSQGFPTYLPLIGAGHSSAYQDEQTLLEFMLKMIQLNQNMVNCDINIVIDEQARDRISILQ